MSSEAAAATGMQASLASCHSCGLLNRLEELEGHHHCRRCGGPLHLRHPDSLNRSWALLLASMVLYVPANLLPITLTTTLGSTQGDTIMEGVIYFVTHGEWPIGLVIFTASILVPLAKMILLMYLLLSVGKGSSYRPAERTRIYRAVEFVGRWSMIDIFVVTIMVALVQLGAVANIDAGDGAIYFCAVVILTMFAAESFDPRLIWDRCQTDG